MIPYDRILIFFVYGLAFFSMGVAMALEAGRSPLLAEARVLRPLAAFGLLHGTYEWLVLFLFQMRWFESPIPLFLNQLRLTLLVLSFVSLFAYGVQIFRLPHALGKLDLYMGVGALSLWGLALAGSPWFIKVDMEWIERGDLLARYLLAVPGSWVAAFATYRHIQYVEVDNRRALRQSLTLAAWGFGLYALSQVFVLPAPWGLAKILNMDTFREIFGIPIQFVRAILAFVITFGLISVTQVVDKDRQRQFAEAQQARLEALESIQAALVQQQEIRREFLRDMVIKQEAERARISRELHDETAQTLTAIRINLAALQNNPQGEQSQILFTRLHAFSDQIAKDIHRMVHELRPAQLDDLGLIAALEYLRDEFQQNFNLKVTLRVSGSKQRLEALVETVLYRIAQEALTNIARHAQTQTAHLEFHFTPAEVRLTISDQGVGFDPHLPPSGRLGLAGMQERVESVGGNIDIQTIPGKGTDIRVTIPFEPPS